VPPVHSQRLRRQEHLDTFVTQDLPDRDGDVWILATREPRPVLDDRDAAPDAPVRLGQLEADILYSLGLRTGCLWG